MRPSHRTLIEVLCSWLSFFLLMYGLIWTWSSSPFDEVLIVLAARALIFLNPFKILDEENFFHGVVEYPCKVELDV